MYLDHVANKLHIGSHCIPDLIRTVDKVLVCIPVQIPRLYQPPCTTSSTPTTGHATTIYTTTTPPPPTFPPTFRLTRAFPAATELDKSIHSHPREIPGLMRTSRDLFSHNCEIRPFSENAKPFKPKVVFRRCT